MSQANQKYSSLDLVYSSKNFRLFYKPSDKKGLEISISKKNFKGAVQRNKIKRKIKEIFRTNLFLKNFNGVVVFSVFRPFGGLLYSEALKEIGLAVDRFVAFYGNK
ncbi:MAG: ribonuclease P protein component [Gammaproteobacteria bacterium]|nr:ribonuclease P protein component [Gammaproteobacteria bacterium]